LARNAEQSANKTKKRRIHLIEATNKIMLIKNDNWPL